MIDGEYRRQLEVLRAPFPRWAAFVSMLRDVFAGGERSFMLVGSATLAHHGVRDVNDLDVFCASPEALDIMRVLGEPAEASEELHYSDAKLVRLDVELPVIGKARIDLFDKLPGVESLTFTEARERFGEVDYESGLLIGTPRLCLAVKAMALRREEKRESTLQDHTDMLALVGLIAREEGDDPPEPANIDTSTDSEDPW